MKNYQQALFISIMQDLLLSIFFQAQILFQIMIMFLYMIIQIHLKQTPNWSLKENQNLVYVILMQGIQQDGASRVME